MDHNADLSPLALTVQMREDLERLKKIRNHRGLRTYWGLRVRSVPFSPIECALGQSADSHELLIACSGQHTKTTGRRGKTVGVRRVDRRPPRLVRTPADAPAIPSRRAARRSKGRVPALCLVSGGRLCNRFTVVAFTDSRTRSRTRTRGLSERKARLSKQASQRSLLHNILLVARPRSKVRHLLLLLGTNGRRRRRPLSARVSRSQFGPSALKSDVFEGFRVE